LTFGDSPPARKRRQQSGSAEADCEVILYDVYSHNGEVFFERDTTCPFICAEHRIRNEEQCRGTRKPRGLALLFVYAALAIQGRLGVNYVDNRVDV
jgi:hypothetical protein